MGLPLSLLGIGLMVQTAFPIPAGAQVGAVLWLVGVVLLFIGK